MTKANTEVNANKVAGMAYLSTVPIVQSVLQDTGTFIRNNHMVYTAATSIAIEKLNNGDASAESVLQSLEKLTNQNEAYLKSMGQTCVEILAEFKKLTDN